MKKTVYRIRFSYQFDAMHKGAPYSFDGEHWMNSGEFLEVADKLCKGFGSTKDANTPFDKGSDIPETETSVKSGKATLTSVKLGYDFESVKRHYFARVHSTNWDFVVLVDDTIVVYNMNKAEFESFVDAWSYFASDRQVIRFKAVSGKMMHWLEKKTSQCNGTPRGEWA